MKRLLFLCRQIWGGNSVLRAFLNYRLSQENLSGKTIDIGGGKDGEYISFMRRNSDVIFHTFDLKAGAVIDFENDRLPVGNAEYDTVLFLNVMEHIFNYQHIANEVVRITKKDGQLIGFVPFLMWYHQDPHDFFRYTDEALEKIFKVAGAGNVIVESVSSGPFIAACHMVLLSVPRLLRVPLFLLSLALDGLYVWARSSSVSRYALGYYFTIKQSAE